MSDLKDKLAEAWVKDLKDRLPEDHLIFPQRRDANVKPPFSVITVMRMEQQLGRSNMWLADVKAVCICDVAQGGSTEQKQRMGELYAAIEGTEPGEDVELGVRFYGHDLGEVRGAKAEKVYSDVIFIIAGVGGTDV